MNPQEIKHQRPELSHNITMKKQMVNSLPTWLSNATLVHNNDTAFY